MRITCPSCEATYEVPERLIGAGRRLRCKTCGHDWDVRPAAPAPAAPPEAGPPPPPQPLPQPPMPPGPPAPPQGPLPPLASPPMTPLAPRAPQVIDPPLPSAEDALPPRPSLALVLAWAASLLLLGTLAGTAWLFRAEITAAWPPAARLFQLVG